MSAHRLSPEKSPVRRPPSDKPAPELRAETLGRAAASEYPSPPPPRLVVLKNGQHEAQALDPTLCQCCRPPR